MENLNIFIFQNELPEAEYLKSLLESCGYEVKWTFLNPKDSPKSLSQAARPCAFLEIQKNKKMIENPQESTLIENHQEECTSKKSMSLLNVSTKKSATHPLRITRDDFDMEEAFFSKKMSYPRKIKSESNTKKNNSSHSFIFESNSALVKIRLEEIIYLEADANYTQIFTEEKKFIIRTSLKDLEEKLNDKRFARVHKSFIINLEKIENIQADFIQIADKEIPIGRQQYRWLTGKIKIL
ncbi:MAG: LytTR family transcriptional regulator [Algoriphagus sp.]|nr:LytTR family transcriptional regulator [Algoriphagus sp.]